MPAKGKHRRPKSQRFTRSIAAAGTGGAALALPLIGAAGAHAATPTAAVSGVSEKAATIAAEKAAAEAGARIEQAEKAAQAEKTATKKAATKTYSVKVGDYLSKIADEQDVEGGWKQLYSDNRVRIGSDPSLIHPGLKLSIGGQAASGGTSQSSKPQLSQSSTAAESSQSSKSADSAKQESKDTQASTSTSSGQSSSSSSSGFSLPIQGATVGTAYKTAGSMWSSGYHTGVDFVAPTGTTLKSVGAGTVVSAGWGGAYGNQVVIKLADGYYAQYAHLSSISVSAGQSVSGGQQIGLSGATGNVTGPHLHFEIRTTPNYGSDIDPLAYLRSKGVSV
ncbi:LysM peptidoglycan-binding domain-containing M23 family metallopeptidase [Streptomyces europaeiscabiei]|uniref:LysM peptidoglycan-binding domain-containing M23 family metallopeptidase n=1 Tax=Streptomyces europaeiscabiei TaxID=146819 RepID=A0ABU4NVJ0_9ACTN|nr:LysM peptidoglycan-binding domain-containing M23 family metallopeptidase [Streptomyces europaeiscabiei]MDX2759540.1 LysM peptidoglycan-binding domain-containing M23 family metallopeptidase [Streptomyces europaeiscabiei]MDX2768893.1 LysM peptidoglycan-binding domain-containing M23 family metallopeptidase [Streptomyces europaeiscabiei]MDX3542297.1 LysM peptidoglycan-binding domain-containing M23 family metallopeptidase [Streptomyces europaeiscabiei]MDX3551345.1 LysM peptidoglycan-binding domai